MKDNSRNNKPEEIINDVSGEKFQQDQGAFDTNLNPTPGTSGEQYNVQKPTDKGSALKQAEVSKIITKESLSGGDNSGGSALRAISVSGGFAGTLGTHNATPDGEKSRSESRYGRKNDRVSNYIDYMPSEQVLNPVDEIPDLGQDPTSTVNYNGTYHNESPRIQKNAGSTPSNLMFDRSVDFIFRDHAYFVEGQVAYNKDRALKTNTPTRRAVKDARGYYTYPESDNYNVQRGNYLTREMGVTFADNGKVLSMAFDEIDCTTYVEQEALEESAANADIHANYAEIVREEMDDKAGDETKPAWSCIPRAIAQPNLVIGLGHDMESMVGAEVFVQPTKLNTSLSFQISRSHKDGQYKERPIVEAITGMRKESIESSDYDGITINDLFDSNEYHKGSAAIMIDAYDSAKKYSKKSDFLTQPRSFRLHLNTAMNNIAPFKCNTKLAQIFKGEEVFSTIDRGYDPSLPVCISDKAAIIHPLSYNDLGAYYRIPICKATTGTSRTKAIMSKYLLKLHNTHKMIISTTIDGVGIAASISNNILTVPDNTTYYVRIVDSSDDANAITIGTDISVSNDLFAAGSSLMVEADEARHFMTNKGPYAYCFKNLINPFLTVMEFPITKGLTTYFDYTIGSKFAALLKGQSLNVLTYASTQCISLWSLLICAATPDIIDARINTFREFLEYTKNHGYPFHNLISVQDVFKSGMSNYKFTDIDTQLTPNQMKNEAALSWVMPEFFWNISNTNYLAVKAKSGASAGDVSIKIFTSTANNTKKYIFFKKSAGVTISRTTSSSNVLYRMSGAGVISYLVSDVNTAPEGYALIHSTYDEVDSGKYIAIQNAANYDVDFEVLSTVLPYYFNEQDYDVSDSMHAERIKTKFNFSMPSIRAGVRYKFLDDFFAQGAKQVLLTLDRITTLDIYNHGQNDRRIKMFDAVDSCGVYKYGSTTDGQIFVTFEEGLSLKNFLSLPRMLGWFIVLPGQVLTPHGNGQFLTEDENILHTTSYRIKYYTNSKISKIYYNSDSYDISAADKEDYNIDTAANYKQVWHQVFADDHAQSYDYGMMFGSRLLLGASKSVGGDSVDVQIEHNASMFRPFLVEKNNVVSKSSGLCIFSMQKALWTRIQKLPFIISPFDAYNNRSGVENSISTDIFELGYVFGLCGFRAADYQEYIYNRQKLYFNQGRLFVQDPFVVDSPLFKEGANAGNMDEQSLGVKK